MAVNVKTRLAFWFPKSFYFEIKRRILPVSLCPDRLDRTKLDNEDKPLRTGTDSSTSVTARTKLHISRR